MRSCLGLEEGASTPQSWVGRRSYRQKPILMVLFFCLVVPLQFVQFQNPKTCLWLPSAGAREVLTQPSLEGQPGSWEHPTPDSAVWLWGKQNLVQRPDFLGSCTREGPREEGGNRARRASYSSQSSVTQSCLLLIQIKVS